MCMTVSVSCGRRFQAVQTAALVSRTNHLWPSFESLRSAAHSGLDADLIIVGDRIVIPNGVASIRSARLVRAVTAGRVPTVVWRFLQSQTTERGPNHLCIALVHETQASTSDFCAARRLRRRRSRASIAASQWRSRRFQSHPSRGSASLKSTSLSLRTRWSHT